MKRSAGPSLINNGASSKKMKTAKPPAKPPTNESAPKSGSNQQLQIVPRAPKPLPLTPLNAKQLKAFHYLLSGASYISVLEGSQDIITNLRVKCQNNYHGVDDNNIGVARNFLEGNGRFEILWESGSISGGLNHLSGLVLDSIQDVIRRPTLRGKKFLSGRQILDKARECIKEAKKLLA